MQFCGGHWEVASGQFSSNSVQLLQRSRKCLSQSKARVVTFFSGRPEEHKVVRGRWGLVSCQISSNSIQWLQRRSLKCICQSKAKVTIFVFHLAPKHKLVRGRWDLASYSAAAGGVWANLRPRRPSLFLDRPQNTILVEDVEYLLPIKCHHIPYSGCR